LTELSQRNLNGRRLERTDAYVDLEQVPGARYALQKQSELLWMRSVTESAGVGFAGTTFTTVAAET
jgi:hypothetical protein